MENIQVYKTISGGMFRGYEEIDKIFKPYELQKAIDYIENNPDPDHWFSVSQGDVRGISGEELTHDRMGGEIYHNLTGY